MRGSLVVLLAMSLFAARASSAQSTDAATKADDKQCLERQRGNPSETGLANRADPTQQGNKNCLPPVLGHATINGVVFFDLDQNGMLGSEEVGISGWQVQLSGPVTQTVTTDANGAFSFSGLTAGDYTVATRRMGPDPAGERPDDALRNRHRVQDHRSGIARRCHVATSLLWLREPVASGRACSTGPV